MSANYKKKAFQLIIFFGMVSLFGDIVYEGALYDHSIVAVIAASVALQIFAIPVFFMMKREISRQVV